ncbi:xylose isomerase [Comamonas sp. SCN 65-56]|uniref:xylose isomerase n=1 Tax=Comamonas sp. SCN 65-56 TaxID=1660095 RepID=UPI000A492A0E|nr:xylose isomerase [Comamonas sp. SCN 65-56]
MKHKPILLGCAGRGVQNSSIQSPVSLNELSVDLQFHMVVESGVFDFFDRLPLTERLEEYIEAVQKYSFPVLGSAWTYKIGADPLGVLQGHLKNCASAGVRYHNMMILAHHLDGHVVTDQELVDLYLRSYELGQKYGVGIGFEVHILMWSEDFRRVSPVARRIRDQGVPFNFVMDYSHCIFKIGNPKEQKIFDIDEDVRNGALVLDPFEKGNLADEWLGMNMVWWQQNRPAVPNGPCNQWAFNDDGTPGRGVQYPFLRPRPGEWYDEWHEYLLEPTKEVVRKTLRHHLSTEDSPLELMTVDYINLPDYGLGVQYNTFESSVAVAKFIRTTYAQICNQLDAKEYRDIEHLDRQSRMK